RAAAIVGEGYRTLFAQGRLETVERWVGRCGSATGDAAFNLARAEGALRRGRLREAQAGLAAVADSLGDAHLLAARVSGHLAHAYEHFSRYDDAVDAALRGVELSRDDGERLDLLYLAVRTAGECRPDLLPELVARLEAEPPTVEARATLARAGVF